jgi:nucleoid DNA-binding protein
MNLKELVDAVATSTGVKTDSVKKVLDTTFATIHKELKGEGPIKLAGFGTLVKKPAKNGGEPRIVFRAPISKAEREVRKQKRLTKKSEAAG